MRIEEFDYNLPDSLIAQYPSPERAESRLMVLHRDEYTIEHRFFRDMTDYLRPDDLLVVNDSRVLPVRLIGRRETGGKCEVLLIPSQNGSRSEWEALIKNAKKVRPGTRIRFADGLTGEIKEVKGGRVRICFAEDIDVTNRLQEVGHIPLPPYIKREDEP
jgi:S-adenosylmethionine:tRNA ribosyltransferase-isomerase